MAENTPVSLDGWPSRRPVKLAGPTAEHLHASRLERTKVTLRLPNEVADTLRVWCATHRCAAQDLVAELLVSHFRMDGQPSTDHDLIDLIPDDNKEPKLPSSSTNRSTGRPDGHKPTDTLTPAELDQLPEVERTALRFYQTHFGNQPRHRDRAAFAEVAQLAQHHIIAGIGVSKLRAKFRVNAFRYCLGAIHEVAESGVGPEYAENITRHLRKQQSQPNLPSIGAEVKEFETGNHSL